MVDRNAILKYLDEHDFITTQEAKKLGFHPMTLSRLTKAEEIFRVEESLYTRKTDWLTHPLKKYLPICTLIPEAIVCGLSALTYYDLTDEEERQIWISLPVHKKIRKSRYRIIRQRGLNYSLGIQAHHFGKRTVRIYDLEKTIVDSFRYLGEEVALKAIKGYLKQKDKNIKKLCEYGRQLRKPLDDVVRVILAEE